MNTLSELPPKLRDMLLLVPDKRGAGTTVDDAETLARYENLVKGTNKHRDFVEATAS